MNSAAQTFQSVKRLPATGEYAATVMRTLAPFIDRLALCVGASDPATDLFSVNNQLMNIQATLAEAKRAIEANLPATMLSEGGSHPYFVAISQRSQGEWIRDTYRLIASLGESIRVKLYAKDGDSLRLRSEMINTDSREELSLPRLLRAVAKSYPYTDLYLGVPSQRALYGIKTDFGAGSLRRFLANSSLAV